MSTHPFKSNKQTSLLLLLFERCIDRRRKRKSEIVINNYYRFRLHALIDLEISFTSSAQELKFSNLLARHIFSHLCARLVFEYTILLPNRYVVGTGQDIGYSIV